MTVSGEVSSSSSLQNLKEIRTSLDQLRSNRSSYIKSADVEALFAKLNTELPGLKELEGDSKLVIDDEEKSDVARALEEDLILISLTYMTIGKNNEPPAIFTLLIVIQILLKHLVEAGIYSRRDLKNVEIKFEEFENILARNQGHYDPAWLQFFESHIKMSRDDLVVVKSRLDPLSPLLDPLYERMVSIMRQIVASASRLKTVPSELHELQDALAEIEAARVDGKFVASDGTVPGGQELVLELYGHCTRIVDLIAKDEVKINPTFEDTYNRLSSIKGKLEKLALTQAWSLRETDLFDHLQEIRRVDKERINGRFIGSDGSSADEGQKILLYLLRKSYATIYELLSSSKAISESLQPIYNQLTTLKKCLLEVQRSGGVSSSRDLFPFSINKSTSESILNLSS